MKMNKELAEVTKQLNDISKKITNWGKLEPNWLLQKAFYKVYMALVNCIGEDEVFLGLRKNKSIDEK